MSRLRLLLCLAGAILCSFAFSTSASALPFTVNTNSTDTTDNIPGNGVCEVHTGVGDCTLSAAIEETSATPAADTIDFSVTGPFTLFSSKAINHPLTIDGDGSGVDGTVVRGRTVTDDPDTHRLFEVHAPVTLKDLRLVDGGLTNGGQGGALYLHSSATLDNVTLTSNQITGASSSGLGAAIVNDQPTATLLLMNSTVSDNTVAITGGFNAQAAGIYTAGPLGLTDSTVTGNTNTGTSGTQGAGIYAEGPFSIARSTISGNTISPGSSSAKGAGVYSTGVFGGPWAVTNSTFSGNSAAAGNGGGLAIVTSGAATIDSSTFASNSGTLGGADIYTQNSPTVMVKNTILASTASSPCLETNPDTIVSAVPGHNIDVGTSCGFGNMNENQEMTDPEMTGLTPFGNGQMLHLLLFGSPAIDAADPSCGGGLTTDQRGLERPQGTVCDIGAYERDYRLVTVNKTGTGTVTGTGIDCGGDCEGSYLDGGPDVVLTATPGAGFEFTSWTGDCESIAGSQCTVDVGNHRTVTATFTALPPPPETTTPAKKTCKKGQKLKKNKCVKKKRKKKK